MAGLLMTVSCCRKPMQLQPDGMHLCCESWRSESNSEAELHLAQVLWELATGERPQRGQMREVRCCQSLLLICICGSQRILLEHKRCYDAETDAFVRTCAWLMMQAWTQSLKIFGSLFSSNRCSLIETLAYLLCGMRSTVAAN